MWNTNSGLKLSKYKEDTSDIIQNVLEENNMYKAAVYMWTKREKEQWRVLAEKGNVWAGKIHTKKPQIVETIESFSDQICKAF